jgi:hypothetical protein
MRDAKPVDDVLRLDARPHDDAQLRQLRANGGEPRGERPLLLVERGRFIEQRRALGVEHSEFARAVRNPAITLGIFSGRHASSPRRDEVGEAPIGSYAEAVTATERNRRARVRHLHPATF